MKKSTREQHVSRKTEAVLQMAAPIPTNLSRGIRPKRAPAATAAVQHEDPVLELRRLVGEHRRLAKTIQRWETDVKPRTFPDGVVLPPVVKPGTQADDDVRRAIATLKVEQRDHVKAAIVQLKRIPIYQELLSRVWCVGPGILAAYLVALIDIRKAPKVSNLIRYCGNEPNRDKTATPKTLGGTGRGCDSLRRNNWLIMTTMRKCAAKRSEEAPHGKTTKYLDRWYDAKHTRLCRGEPRYKADNAGRKKATDLLLWDLYVMWRTLEGLEVWPDKWAQDRGFFHGGTPVWDRPRHLTLEEARAVVGDVGARPLAAPRVDPEAAKEVEEVEDAAAE